MTSPNEPPKESLRDRISDSLSRDKSGRYMDAEAQHTRNVSWLFYGVIVAIIAILVGGLVYGFWESNLKPVASVDGDDVSRGELDERKALLTFRFDRLNELTSQALADGTIDADLANRRFTIADSQALLDDATTLNELVDLLYQEQLAAEEGVTLSEEELQSAVESDGTVDEARQVDAIIVSTEELQQGFAATDESLADARVRASAAAEALAAGGDPQEIADEYAPAEYQSAWITYEDLVNGAWADRIFSAEIGDVTEVVEDDRGFQLISLVNGIAAEQPDPGFVEAVNDAVGEDVHRRQVGLEALSAKLEQSIVDAALAAEYEQFDLAEIFIERNPGNTDDTVGEAKASHILYVPETPTDEEGVETAVADLPTDDPAWAAAEAEAQAAFDELSAIEDIDERMTAFAERAIAESDGPSGPDGGDLGWFARETMVTEFSDAIWENIDPQQGDILGPVRTDFGWHVILFDEFRSSLDVRVRDAQNALEEDGAEFADVAREYSDGPEADDGGAIGWRVADYLDDELFLNLSILAVGETSEPIDGGDGYRIYQLLEKASRPLEDDDAAQVAEVAWSEWYDDRYFDAIDTGAISIDESIYDQ